MLSQSLSKFISGCLIPKLCLTGAKAQTAEDTLVGRLIKHNWRGPRSDFLEDEPVELLHLAIAAYKPKTVENMLQQKDIFSVKKWARNGENSWTLAHRCLTEDAKKGRWGWTIRTDSQEQALGAIRELVESKWHAEEEEEKLAQDQHVEDLAQNKNEVEVEAEKLTQGGGQFNRNEAEFEEEKLAQGAGQVHRLPDNFQ